MAGRPGAEAPELTDLAQEMGFTDRELARRKAWHAFGDEDVARLKKLNEIAQGYADAIIEELYGHFLAFDETREFFKDPQVLQRVKGMQRRYFLQLTEGSYDMAYARERLKIGAVHSRIGLGIRWYLGAYAFYLRSVGDRIFKHFAGDPAEALASYNSLKKLVFIDIGLALDTIVHLRERTIRVQQEAIRELSTPVLEVAEGLLLLPIIGVMDTERARQVMEQLLLAARQHRARAVVLDITGLVAVDTKVADHLLQTTQALRLMGAEVLVTGISTGVAQTLTGLGVDLSGLRTFGSVRNGLAEAFQRLGITPGRA